MSSIVATSLVITITILAGAILGSFIVPFVQKNLERSSECNDFENHFTLEEDVLEDICYQPTSKGNYVVVGAKNDKAAIGNVVGFQVLFIQVSNPSNPGGKAMSILVKQSGASADTFKLLDSGNKPVTAIPPKPGEVSTYVFNDGQKYNRVEISTIVGNGRVCERKGDSVKILACGTSAGRA